MSEQAVVAVRGLKKSYASKAGGTIPAIGDVSFEVQPGQTVSIVGPSGCGKTTLLRTLAGLLAPDRGEVRIEDDPIRGVTPGLSVVFQEYNRSLFPWLTIEKNVGFGLHDLDRSTRRERCRVALEQVGLGDVGDLHPWQVSGGMQQRVAIARAIAVQPRVLLMDEPFASVDAQTRWSLEELTMRISRELGLACILITHDIDEAVLMSDRVVVLSHRPSHVVADISIDLAWPRGEIDTKADPRFSEYRKQVHDLITAASSPGPQASGGRRVVNQARSSSVTATG